jgi:hypothetical protein
MNSRLFSASSLLIFDITPTVFYLAGEDKTKRSETPWPRWHGGFLSCLVSYKLSANSIPFPVGRVKVLRLVTTASHVLGQKPFGGIHVSVPWHNLSAFNHTSTTSVPRFRHTVASTAATVTPSTYSYFASCTPTYCYYVFSFFLLLRLHVLFDGIVKYL